MPDLELAAETAQPIPDYSRLTREEIERVKYLAKAGFTQVQIAEQLQCAQSTVSKWLTILQDPIEDARHILREGLPEMAKRTVKEAAPSTCVEVFDRFKVTERPGLNTGKAGVTVIIGATDSAVQVNLVSLSPSVE